MTDGLFGKYVLTAIIPITFKEFFGLKKNPFFIFLIICRTFLRSRLPQVCDHVYHPMCVCVCVCVRFFVLFRSTLQVFEIRAPPGVDPVAQFDST